MKNLIILFATIFLLGTMFSAENLYLKKLLSGNTTNIQGIKDTKKQDDDYKKYRTEQEQKIRENEKVIAELKTKKSQVKKEKLTNYENKINELEKKNNELRKKIIVNYKNQGVSKWESFKNEFNHDMGELKESLKDLFKDNVKE
jgi:acetyl-CoA carboxylase alpha subunit